jgi:hypothetical protein
MTEYKQAKDLLGKNQEAVVVFTHGKHFEYDPGGNGFTGNWVVDPDVVEEVEKVIIYFREESEIVNRIFLGNYASLRKAEIPGRFIIRFSGLKEVGTTDANWIEFASSGQNPVSYVVG